MRRPTDPRAVRTMAAVAVCAGLIVAGCSNGGGAPPTSDTQVLVSTTVRPDDGTLVIGAVLPTVGAASEIGVSMTNALALGIREINEAGGVNGRSLRLVTREEGDNSASAVLAVQNLMQLGADAIIGPTSSLNMLSTLGTAVEAGLLTCGPTASALALDAFPDDGLFFRTIPSDSLQAQAIARVVEASGSSNAAVVYLDDPYGRPFAEATRAAIQQEGTDVTPFVGFTSSETSISDAVRTVLAADPDVVAVVADALTGPAIITAIDAASTSDITFVVNDASRRPDASAQPFDPGLATRVLGVSPLAYSNSTTFIDALRTIDPEATGLYAHNAYDCLNIIALAAIAAGSTVPAEIAAQIPAVTASGTTCNSFPECAEALSAGRNVNYEGPSGNLSINTSGEMTSAVFDRFTFDENGRDDSTGTIRIGDG